MLYRSFLAVTLILTLTACSWDQSHDVSTHQDESSQKRFSAQEELLFVFHAKDGYLSEDSKHKDEYILTLYGVDKNVTFFSDRPIRRAGKMPTEKFLKDWDLGKDSFKKGHPNAALVSVADSQKPGSFSDVPVMLSDPHYEKKHDRLTFTVTVIEKEIALPKGELGEATLFIDSVCASCAIE